MRYVITLHFFVHYTSQLQRRNVHVVVPTYLRSACTQNHSCMGSIPDSSAVREESGTKTNL